MLTLQLSFPFLPPSDSPDRADKFLLRGVRRSLSVPTHQSRGGTSRKPGRCPLMAQKEQDPSHLSLGPHGLKPCSSLLPKDLQEDT